MQSSFATVSSAFIVLLTIKVRTSLENGYSFSARRKVDAHLLRSFFGDIQPEEK